MEPSGKPPRANPPRAAPSSTCFPLEGVSVGGRCGVPCPPNPRLSWETPWPQPAWGVEREDTSEPRLPEKSSAGHPPWGARREPQTPGVSLLGTWPLLACLTGCDALTDGADEVVRACVCGHSKKSV